MGASDAEESSQNNIGETVSPVFPFDLYIVIVLWELYFVFLAGGAMVLCASHNTGTGFGGIHDIGQAKVD